MVTTLVNQGFGVFLISLRFAAFLVTAPYFSMRAVPVHLKIMIPLALALVVRGAIAAPHVTFASSEGDIALAVAHEFIVGAFMGLMVQFLFMVVTLAFEIVGMQIGFAIARIFDPAVNDQVSILSNFMMILAGVLFFTLNFHHHIIAAIVISFRKIPVGGDMLLDRGILQTLVSYFAVCFEYAIRLSMPVMIAILLSNLVMGIITKTSPQMNMFFNVAFSVNIAMGLIITIIMMPQVRLFFERAGADLTQRLLGTL